MMLLKARRASLCLPNVLDKLRGCCFYHRVSLSQQKKNCDCTIRYLQTILTSRSATSGILPLRQTYQRELLSVTKCVVDFNCFSKRCYSSFKDDDMVKSWMKEIKEDFEKTKLNEKELNEEYFKDIEKESIIEEQPELNKDEGLSPEKQQSLQKLEELANRYAGLQETETTDTSSDSDLLSSASESDSSDDEKDTKPLSSSEANVVEGFTAEEMIEMLDRNEIADSGESDLGELSDSSESDTEELNDSHTDGETKDSSDKTTSDSVEIPKSAMGVAATRIGGDRLQDDWGVVEIEDFVNIKPEPEVEPPWVPPISLERGKTGVFDIEDMVTLLRSANAFDIAVIQLPRAIQLGDHMVIASAKSIRQMTAIGKDIQWIYKKRVNKRNAHLRIEGEKTDWQAMDIGNMMVHLFLPEVRKVYDLETLWTVGPAHDDNCREEEGTDPYVFSLDDLPWLKNLESNKQNEDKSRNDQETIQIMPASKKYGRR